MTVSTLDNATVASVSPVMAFTIDRVQLLNRVKFMDSAILERRNTVPILSNVLIRRDLRNGLEIVASDLDIQAVDAIDSSYIGWESIDFDRITLNAKSLTGALSALEGERVHFRAVDGKAIVSDGDTDAKLHTLPGADYPLMSIPAACTCAYEVDISQMEADFKRLIPSISTEETRYYLNGIHFGIDESGAIAMASTDGHRLALIKRDEGMTFTGEAFTGIVHRKTVNVIQKSIGKLDGCADVYFYPGKFEIVLGSLTITAKLVDGTFPDYTRVIPSRSDGSINVDAKEFGASLKKIGKLMKAVATEKTRAVKLEGNTVSFSSPENGTGSTKFKGDVSESFPVIGFNHAYLAAMVDLHDGALTIATQDSGAPTLMKSTGAPEFTSVLMPMRV